jgi:brefeldin A-inhibited guanine nucleotide-exchange protein
LQATLTLFDLLITYGEHFSREFWKRIMHEIFKPLFDGSEYAIKLTRKTSISGGGDELRVDNEPLREIFSRLVDLHNLFRPKLDYFTKDFVEFLVDCAKKSSELVAKISVNTLRFIINHNHSTLTKNEWETILAAFKEIFDKTLPRQLLTYKNIQPQDGRVRYF